MPLGIVRQDITRIDCDAIVNVINSSDAEKTDDFAGIEIRSRCKEGDAVITEAVGLPCKYIIHTVISEHRVGEPPDQNSLNLSYEASLRLALEKGCERVAVPLSPLENCGYPSDKILKIAASAVEGFLCEHDINVDLVIENKSSYKFNPTLFSKIISYMDKWGTNELKNHASIRTREALDGLKRERMEAFERLLREKAERQEKREREHTGASAFADGRGFFCRAGSHAKIRPPRTSESIHKGKTTHVASSVIEEINSMDQGFAELLFEYIDKSGMSDVECYKRANIDRKIFSKIKCNKDYRPSKATAVSFAVALKLNIRDTNRLLETLGMTLSRSIEFDVIIQYFLMHRIYDINVINETLFEFDQVLLGS